MKRMNQARGNRRCSLSGMCTPPAEDPSVQTSPAARCSQEKAVRLWLIHGIVTPTALLKKAQEYMGEHKEVLP